MSGPLAAPASGADAALPPIRSRDPLGHTRFAVWSNVAIVALGLGGYFVAVNAVGQLPASVSVVVFGAAPICAAFALPVLVARGRRDPDPAIAWFAVGLAVALVALTLQFISFPAVTAGGGPLRTSPQGSAVLYLAYHVALPAGALAGALGASPRWRPRALLSALVLLVLVAAAPLPLPMLLEGTEQAYTALLVVVDALLIGLSLVAVWVWARRVDQWSSELRGWVGLTLSLVTLELFLNMLADQRFSQVWWASASMRAAAFLVLLAGCLRYLLVMLSRVEDYGERELARREGELEESHSVSDALLRNAQRLATCLSPAQVADTLRDSVGAALPGSSSCVYQLDQQRGRMVLLAGDAAEGREAFPLDDPGTVGRTNADGRPLFAGGAAHLTPAAVLPMRVGGLGIGCLVVDGPPVTDPTTRTLVRGLADQAGTALSRARLYERERTAAETLQRALLPRRLPAVDGLDVASRYLPATVGTRVGGDWFDCLVLPDGRVALLVGDVVGKGLRAAGVMGQFRSAFQALVTVDPTPSAVLGWLNSLAATRMDEMAATVVYALVDVSGASVRVARAGHVPLLVVDATGSSRYVEQGGGPPLGVVETSYDDVCIPLADGTSLVMYTDGLVEDRRASLDDGLDRLRDAAGAVVYAGGSADEVASVILDASGGSAGDDDIALLVARFSPSREKYSDIVV